MLLPKDCIMITQGEAEVLLAALGIGRSTGIRDIQGIVASSEHIDRGDCDNIKLDAMGRAIYNLLQAVKALDPTEVY